MELGQVSSMLYQKSEESKEIRSSIKGLAIRKADAERAYRVALAQEMFKLKAEKHPAALISEMAKGNIADKLYERDLSEALHKAASDHLKAIQSEMSSLQSILRYQEEIG